MKADLLLLEIQEFIKNQEDENTLDIEKALDDAFDFSD
jgi:hypothetical protein